MASAVPVDVLARAQRRVRSDPGFAAALTALVDAPPRSAGDYTHVAALEVNRQRRQNVIDEFKDGAVVTADAQRLLGLGTPQAVHRLRSRGKLIGLQIGNATWFPSWQFSDGRLRPELARVLELTGRFTDDPVAADRIMRLVRDDLAGRSLAEALDDPDLAETAWAVFTDLAG